MRKCSHTGTRKLMKPQIALSESTLETVAASLRPLLADTFVLYIKTRNAHWNVTGMDFKDLHELFEGQFDTYDEHIDELAERLRQLGFASPGSMAEYLASARLKEKSGAVAKGADLLATVMADQEALIGFVRQAVDDTAAAGDAGTSDLLTGHLRALEKIAWFTRAHLHQV